MVKRYLLLLLALYALPECSWAPAGGPVSPGKDGVSAEQTAQMQANYKADNFQKRLDSVVSLLEFGDINGFFFARDSLQIDLQDYLGMNPSASEDSVALSVLVELGRLDSLALNHEYRHPYLSQEDSIALSVLEWPDSAVHIDYDGYSSPEDTAFHYIENKRIAFWLRYFTGPGKSRFARNLYRLENHRPTVEKILAELDLPPSLICIPLIESGFNMKARSKAKAVGPWQFLAGTGRIYGLRVNWWVDERRDIVASTYAAGNYLKDLYAVWHSWLLALASYNAGEYRVAGAVVRQKTEDFWRLKLPRQTERYVPKFLAALYILRNPPKYGFDIPRTTPDEFDAVTVTDATDLKLIARLSDASLKFIRNLNPAILRWCTPPKARLDVKVPKGKGASCTAKLLDIPPSKRVTWRRHRIRNGETLSLIARKFGTSIGTLKRLNGIKNSHLIRAGKTLIVPLKGEYTALASSKPIYSDKRRKLSKKALESYALKRAAPAGYKKVEYFVKDRDNLGAIAELYHTRASKIRRWNNLSFRSYIYPGQKLKIYVPKSFKSPRASISSKDKPSSQRGYMKRNYVVKKGDTIYHISKKFNVMVSDLLAWNGKGRKSFIHPGEELEIWIKKP